MSLQFSGGVYKRPKGGRETTTRKKQTIHHLHALVGPARFDCCIIFTSKGVAVYVYRLNQLPSWHNDMFPNLDRFLQCTPLYFLSYPDNLIGYFKRPTSIKRACKSKVLLNSN